jgi:hypothetical protein
VSDLPETLLEMARRHVRDGEERVMRQEAAAAELERDNYHEAAALGRELLEAMRTSLDLAKRHLWDVEA